MALPTTTASSISLSQIQTEFGGSNPISLSEYVRGGTYVPSGTATGTYGTAIPTTNSNLSMKNYYGTQSVFITTMTVGIQISIVTWYGYWVQPYGLGAGAASAGSLSDNTIDTMSGTPTILRLAYISSGVFSMYLTGDQTSASPQLSTLDWENTTQTTSGTITLTVGSYNSTDNFTNYSGSGSNAFSTSENDNVIWTFNAS